MNVDVNMSVKTVSILSSFKFNLFIQAIGAVIGFIFCYSDCVTDLFDSNALLISSKIVSNGIHYV